MKQLLYFLIGFCLVVFPAKWAYSAVVYPIEPDASVLQSHFESRSQTIHAGYYNTKGECWDASGGYNTTSVPGAVYWRYCYTSEKIAYYAWASGATYETTPPIVDTDEDGIPDECDFYPYNSDPYQYKRIAWQADNSYSIYITDKGDYFSAGTAPESEFLDFYDHQAAWQDPSASCGDLVGFTSGSTGSSTLPEAPIYSGSLPDGTPPGGDPEFSPGESSDGTETGAEQKIIDNTKTTADNIAKQVPYLKDINKGIQNLDRAIGKQGSTLSDIDRTLKQISDKLGKGDGVPIKVHTDEDGDGTGDEGDGDGDGTAAWDAVDPGAGWGDGALTELVPGTDYTEHGELKDEGFIVTFLANNPIKTALDNSGFLLSGAACSVSLNLGTTLGTHDLSLCEFQSQIMTAGNILFGLTVILSLMIVARGI
jgi:hypothetical protein